MYGTWHRYREGETWRKPRCQASLELLTDDDVFVCFNAKEVELVATASVRERILKTRLGPDLIDAETNPRIVVRRARALLSAETPMVDVLLDQRVAAGIGNVYKSEVLFIRQCPPLRSLESINDTALEACYATAADLLRRNLGGGRRITRFERDDAGRLWVYGRGNLPCLRCGTRISYARLGKDLRGTYWCAGCQT
jgi:endonuclease-8